MQTHAKQPSHPHRNVAQTKGANESSLHPRERLRTTRPCDSLPWLPARYCSDCAFGDLRLCPVSEDPIATFHCAFASLKPYWLGRFPDFQKKGDTKFRDYNKGDKSGALRTASSLWLFFAHSRGIVMRFRKSLNRNLGTFEGCESTASD
jgi:hypothetical protein